MPDDLETMRGMKRKGFVGCCAVATTAAAVVAAAIAAIKEAVIRSFESVTNASLLPLQLFACCLLFCR